MFHATLTGLRTLFRYFRTLFKDFKYIQFLMALRVWGLCSKTLNTYSSWWLYGFEDFVERFSFLDSCHHLIQGLRKALVDLHSTLLHWNTQHTITFSLNAWCPSIFHRPNSTHHDICDISCGALNGTNNSSFDTPLGIDLTTQTLWVDCLLNIAQTK